MGFAEALLESPFSRGSKLSLSGVHNAMKITTWNINGVMRYF
jgi:hypothetical protein